MDLTGQSTGDASSVAVCRHCYSSGDVGSGVVSKLELLVMPQDRGTENCKAVLIHIDRIQITGQATP